MDLSTKKIRQNEEGFTLVELAVVMIIIGLLIGGILKGQELITNARVTSTASQLEAMGAAYNGFRDKFNAIPGDMLTATGANGRLSNCGAGVATTPVPSCFNGDGDGLIDINIGAAGTAAAAGAGGESGNFFGQLLAADFITGMDGTAPLSFGNAFPTAPIGGGFLVGDGRNGVTAFTAAEVRPAPHVVINGSTAVVGAGSGVLTPQQAANIDRRLDDGVPNGGSVVAQAGNAADCRRAVNIYSNLDSQVCAIAYRLQ